MADAALDHLEEIVALVAIRDGDSKLQGIAQECLDLCAPARVCDAEHRRTRAYHRPQPGWLIFLQPARLIDVPHRRLLRGEHSLGIWRFERSGNFLLDSMNAAQSNVYAPAFCRVLSHAAAREFTVGNEMYDLCLLLC